jgi:hypothetical protein
MSKLPAAPNVRWRVDDHQRDHQHDAAVRPDRVLDDPAIDERIQHLEVRGMGAAVII